MTTSYMGPNGQWVTLTDTPQKVVAPYPDGATALTNSSGNVANAAATATLTSASSRLAYLSGFEITAGGATAPAVVTATVTGLLGGTLSYTFPAVTGAAVAAAPLVAVFNPPLPASAANTNIVVSLPALGAGNTNACAVAHGYLI